MNTWQGVKSHGHEWPTHPDFKSSQDIHLHQLYVVVLPIKPNKEHFNFSSWVQTTIIFELNYNYNCSNQFPCRIIRKQRCQQHGDRHNSPRTMWESSSRSRDKTQAPMQHLIFPSFLQLKTTSFLALFQPVSSLSVYMISRLTKPMSFNLLSASSHSECFLLLVFFLNMSLLCFFHLTKVWISSCHSAQV